MKHNDTRPLVRRILIACINGGLLIVGTLTIAQTYRAQISDPVLHYKAAPIISVSHVIWLLPLAIGLLAEALNWQVAKLVNIGYYALTFVWMLLGTILAKLQFWGFAEPEHWLIGVEVIGVPSGCFAVLLWWLYKVPAHDRPGIGASPS